MTALELPCEMKRTVLALLRERLGEREYEQLVAALGEDGLIDAVLDRMKAWEERVPGLSTMTVTGYGTFPEVTWSWS